MTREIALSQGLVALVDDADYELVIAQGKWHAAHVRRTTYARRNYWVDSKCITMRMHSFLTGWSLVDHINGDGLDNRRSNLRPATPKQNGQNRRVRWDNLTGYKGVTRRGTLFRAYIYIDGTMKVLGSYRDVEDAAAAYDAAALEMYGEFARLNLPQGGDVA